MKLLLDTHTWVWSVADPGRLSGAARGVLTDPANPKFLSPVSVWETAMLSGKGRLTLRPDLRVWIASALAVSPTSAAELTHDAALIAATLPDSAGRDPADRFLIATALVHDLTLVTADRRIRAYRGVKTLW